MWLQLAENVVELLNALGNHFFIEFEGVVEISHARILADHNRW